ncbi:ABC transporter substrate-binding protein [Deinococcus altitudinis]|uniref:ABC transporter substrate-binding protein n=1 Tax=Deinococcus altitudinis TaxID=468914 RepID=UPI003892AA84
MRIPLFFLAFLGGSSALAATSYPVSIAHSSGTTVVRARPLRVVALGPHALDLLLSLGIQPVGYGEASTFIKTPAFGSPIRDIRVLGSRVTSNPVNVGDRFSPSLEILASLKPDLIVGEDYAAQVYPQLSRIAPTLLFKGIDRSEWQKTLPLLAKAVDREAAYANVLKSYAANVQATRSVLAPRFGNQTVLVVWTGGGEGKNTFNVSRRSDWTGGLLSDLGLNVIDGDKTDKAESVLSVEGLVALNPDVVLVLASGTSTPARARADWNSGALTSRLQASRKGQVFFLDYHLFRRIRGPIAAQLIERQLIKDMAPH